MRPSTVEVLYFSKKGCVFFKQATGRNLLLCFEIFDRLSNCDLFEAFTVAEKAFGCVVAMESPERNDKLGPHFNSRFGAKISLDFSP